MVRYPHANPSLATRAILVPKGLEQLAQRQALLAKQERGTYPPNCKQRLGKGRAVVARRSHLYCGKRHNIFEYDVLILAVTANVTA